MINITWTVSIAEITSLIEQFVVLIDLLYLTLLARGYSQMKREQMRKDNGYNKL